MNHSINPKLVIWGASGHAKVVADIIRLNNNYDLVGFIDDINIDRANKDYIGVPVYTSRNDLFQLLHQGVDHIIIGVGNCQDRLDLTNFVLDLGFNLATAVHPKSVIANDVEIGDGTVIVAGAVINPGSKIGKSIIINTSASVDHDCVIENGAHIGPGAHLSGHVVVERGVWIGVGAVVIDHIRIGTGSIIGAGSVVVKDIPDGVLAYGVPAKIIRKVKAES